MKRKAAFRFAFMQSTPYHSPVSKTVFPVRPARGHRRASLSRRRRSPPGRGIVARAASRTRQTVHCSLLGSLSKHTPTTGATLLEKIIPVKGGAGLSGIGPGSPAWGGIGRIYGAAAVQKRAESREFYPFHGKSRGKNTAAGESGPPGGSEKRGFFEDKALRQGGSRGLGGFSPRFGGVGSFLGGGNADSPSIKAKTGPGRIFFFFFDAGGGGDSGFAGGSPPSPARFPRPRRGPATFVRLRL
jgi:hypothetical protein